MKEEQLFHEALAEPADRRADFINAACGEDADLRQRVEVLLRAHENPGSFLNTPGQNVDIDATIALPVSVEVGSYIGRYKIREQIGEGGMGVVFVAEQTGPIRRKVALKIIKPGMDTKQVIGRFEAERQALALMDNPNIARVHDAGATDTGRPYFVMELVRGLPMTEYCDKHQLSTKDRLALFITVCRAVQHAHLKGIIHRDLKPSNVLITRIDGEGVPKVIDFGVAKATNQQLTERSIYTHYSQMVGTPLYMSPEQAEMSGVDIDTRTDVYSLGVLLYELLTGCTPFDRETMRQATHDEMRRIIREDEPLRPSLQISTLKADAITTHSQQRASEPRKLALVVRGELDWIVMKALDKDRNRRYESASAFATDIEQYLSDEPVAACPPSAVYRLQKYARKNKGRLTTVGLVLAALLTGTGVSLRYAFEANKAATKSKASELVAEREKANALVNLNLATAENERAEEYMQTAFDALDQLFAAVLGGDRVIGETGVTWENEVYEPLTQKESELLETALTLYTRLANSRSDNPRAIFRNALAFKTIGLFYRSQGMKDKAIEAFEQAAERLEEVTANGNGTGSHYKALSQVYYWLANSPKFILNRATLTTKAENARNRYHELEPDGIDALLFRAADYCKRGDFEVACTIVEKAAKLTPNDGTVYWHASGAFFNNGRNDLGLHYCREAVRVQPDSNRFLHRLTLRLLDRGHVDEGHELSLTLTSRAPRYFAGFLDLSKSCHGMGEYENALEAARTAVELNPLYEWTYISRGTAYMACGDFDEGFRDFERAQEILAFEPPITRKAAGLVLSAIQGEYGESKVQKARDFLIRQLAEDPLNELWHLAMADCAKQDGDTETEIASLRSGIELLRTKADEGQATNQAQLSQRLSQLAVRLNAMGRSDEALVEYNKLLERDPSASVRLKVGVLMKSCGDDAGAALQWTQALLEDRAATFVDYRIRIQTPGTYQLYLRAGSHSEGSDSFYVRIVELGDGPGGKIADWFRHYVKPDNTAADFAANDWSGLSEAERTSYLASHTPGTRMVWNLSTPGDYTVRFIMRESGTALDTFVFQLSNRPPPTEPGPPKSTMTKEKVFLELGGLVVVEAEQYFLRNTGSSGHEWRVLPEEASEIATYKNKRGGAYLQSLPDSGVWTRHALSQTAVLEADALKWDLERYNHWTKAEPDDENWYIARAQTYAALNEIDKALADLSKIIERNPKNELAWESRARIFANRRQWKNASTDFSRAHELKKAINYYSRYQYALLALGANDTSAYSTACQKLLQQVLQSESPSELYFAGWTCALAVDAVDDYSLALQLAQKAIDGDADNQQFISGLGALQFRAGQYAEALENFTRAAGSEENSNTSSAYTVYFRAMTEWRLDRKEDARKTLAQANELAHLELSDADDPPAWNRRLTLELLGKEAAALIGEDADGGE